MLLCVLASCAALSAAASVQEVGPPAPDAGAEAPAAELFDSVQLLVNSDCITHSDLLRELWQSGRSREDGADLQQLFRESVAELTRQLLLQQAGKDLGFDPTLISSWVRREKANRRQRLGSATALAELLDARRMDSGMLTEDIEGAVYRYLFERAVTGEGEGPGGRAYVDRFVRPGRMGLEFRRQGSRLDLPPVVHLQEIIVAPGVGEDLGSARQRAFLVRSRALRGEDFAALNREFGEATKRVGNDLVHETDLEPIEEPRLASRPEVLDFVRGAQPGDISEPLPATVAGGQIGGWRLLRLVERVEGVAQRFEDREFQESLRERMVAARKEYEIERALRRLMSAAYVWPPPPARRPAEGPAPAEPQAPPAAQPAAQPAPPPVLGAPMPEEPPAEPSAEPTSDAPAPTDGR